MTTLVPKDAIDADGVHIFQRVYTYSECEDMRRQLDEAMRSDKEQFNVRQSRGTVFAARNVIDLCPQSMGWWKKTAILKILNTVLGDDFGLVRVLYFDKPSDRSWSLPFHKDMTIAVQDNSLPSQRFSKPTSKAGVDHVEADQQLLENMLTLRIHLDRVTEDNGPLQVIPGSHKNGKRGDASTTTPIKILCDAGDVLAMRPLISHGSAHSNSETNMHRRILHFEFSGIRNLPDGFQWHTFETGQCDRDSPLSAK